MSTTKYSSRISGFHKKSVDERIALIAGITGLDETERSLISNSGNLDQEIGNHMIENFVGTMTIPVGIATNVKVDGRDVSVHISFAASSNGIIVLITVCFHLLARGVGLKSGRLKSSILSRK